MSPALSASLGRLISKALFTTSVLEEREGRKKCYSIVEQIRINVVRSGRPSCGPDVTSCGFSSCEGGRKLPEEGRSGVVWESFKGKSVRVGG